ncbi:MAG: DUF2325 domain-containing protein [Pseudomonadota bacterium]
MCELCKTEHKNSKAESGRYLLWEFTDNAHCSVIGTCLSHKDLLVIAQKLNLTVDKNAPDYDVHGYFVKASTQDSPEARAIHKLLDRRFGGALRKVSRHNDQEAQISLWEEMRDSGHLAAAYYAFMTLRNVQLKVRGLVFGEVHMLSHLMGASWRNQSKEIASLNERLVNEQDARKKLERSSKDALKQRDIQIQKLEKEVSKLRALQETDQVQKPVTKRKPDYTKTERALAIARERARSAESAYEALEKRHIALNLQLKAKADHNQHGEKTEAKNGSDNAANWQLSGMRVLYLGGMDHQIRWMKDYAEELGVKLVHHDGGLHHSVTRIDQVLSSIDCVLCPVNCVSHDACLRAKAGCKKHGKPFLPLRSAGKKTFERALGKLAAISSN